jgi:glycosyltransferase involved in cell wall biosynthesis
MIRDAGAQDMRIMIHDLIPLDYPEYTRPDQVDRFRSRLDASLAHADTIIANSEYTAARIRDYAKTEIQICTAHLGIDPPQTGALARAGRQVPAEFLCLGTIEPRKNHDLLLDVWKSLIEILPDAQVPILHIVGRRGWQNEHVFQRLDTEPMMGRYVIEHGALEDKDLAALFSRASALLFPSFAEGYGLPVLEAHAPKLPVICSDLQVLRELLSDHATFLDPKELESWVKKLRTIAIAPQKYHSESQSMGWAKIPTWQNHFELALP